MANVKPWRCVIEREGGVRGWCSGVPHVAHCRLFACVSPRLPLPQRESHEQPLLALSLTTAATRFPVRSI